MSDPVNHPGHYTRGKIQVWDFIADQALDFMLGNVVKYVCRAGHKEASTELEDLKKARAYLEKRIMLLLEQAPPVKGDWGNVIPETVCHHAGCPPTKCLYK